MRDLYAVVHVVDDADCTTRTRQRNELDRTRPGMDCLERSRSLSRNRSYRSYRSSARLTLKDHLSRPMGGEYRSAVLRWNDFFLPAERLWYIRKSSVPTLVLYEIRQTYSFHAHVHGDLSVSIRLAFPYECGSAWGIDSNKLTPTHMANPAMSRPVSS